MSYKWNALWIVSILVFISFFVAYQHGMQDDRPPLRPEGIKIIYSKDLSIPEIQFYVDTTHTPHTIRFESVSNVDLRDDSGLIAVTIPYPGKLLDHSNWEYERFDDEFVFLKEFDCTKEKTCVFTENNQFFTFALDRPIDQKNADTHKVSLQFLDTAASSKIKRWITERYNPDALPLDNSFDLESAKVTVIINEISDDIEPLPTTPIRFSESGNRLLWDIESGILHQLKWENPVERKQIFDLVFFSAVYGIALAILNLIIFSWSQRIKVLSKIPKISYFELESSKTSQKIVIGALIFLAVIASAILGIYLSGPEILISVIRDYIPDRDFDGINDEIDSCPDIPETVNNYQDSDGCPDLGLFSKPIQSLSPVGQYKVSVLEDLVKHPKIIEALLSDNKKYSFLSKPFDYIHQKEIEWREAGDDVTPFMESFIDNHVSNIMNESLQIQSDTFGEIVYGEFILTNGFGANTANTIKTDNFDQASENWWQISKQHGLFIKSCEWDDSAEMHSEDIIIRIEHNGEFIGILNAATRCDVLEKDT